MMGAVVVARLPLLMSVGSDDALVLTNASWSGSPVPNGVYEPGTVVIAGPIVNAVGVGVANENAA